MDTTTLAPGVAKLPSTIVAIAPSFPGESVIPVIAPIRSLDRLIQKIYKSMGRTVNKLTAKNPLMMLSATS